MLKSCFMLDKMGDQIYDDHSSTIAYGLTDLSKTRPTINLKIVWNVGPYVQMYGKVLSV